MYKKCVFAGSFDPVTNGHMEIIGKCAMTFEEVVVVVAVNAEKKYYFDKQTRLEMLRRACRKYGGVRVVAFDGMLVDFLKSEGTEYYVRGIRNDKDLDYENRTFDFNSKLYPEIQTVYFYCGKENSKVSSTLVRSLVERGESVRKYVPFEAIELIENYKK